jgi:hypothetical protein
MRAKVHRRHPHDPARIARSKTAGKALSTAAFCVTARVFAYSRAGDSCADKPLRLPYQCREGRLRLGTRHINDEGTGRPVFMQILERYIFRTAVSAFLLCLIALTAVIWITSALRELDLVTGKGQSILMFLYFTMLSIPALVMIIAPLALFIAIIYTLNKLNGDSELIVMNAAGVPPWRIISPFPDPDNHRQPCWSGLITIKVMPDSFRELRNLVCQDPRRRGDPVRAGGQIHHPRSGHHLPLPRKGTGRHVARHHVPGSAQPNIVTTYLAERGRMVEVGGAAVFHSRKGQPAAAEQDAVGGGAGLFRALRAGYGPA